MAWLASALLVIPLLAPAEPAFENVAERVGLAGCSVGVSE